MLDPQHPSCASSRGNSHIPESEQSAKNTLEMCCAVARSKTRNSQNSEDYAQDAWIKQHQAIDQYDHRNGALASTFLFQVVSNSITDGCRRESRHQAKAGNDEPDLAIRLHSDRSYRPDQYAEYADTLNALSEVAADLPLRQQMLLERHFLGAGESIKVLAKEFQCTVQSLYQARKALFQKLESAGVLPPQ